MSDVRMRIAREMVEAFNGREIERLLGQVAADFEFVPAVAAGVEGESATVHGADGLRRFFAQLAETWENFEIEPDQFRELGLHVLVRGRVRATGKGSGVELDQPLFIGIWFEGDQIARVQGFFEEGNALTAFSQEARR